MIRTRLQGDVPFFPNMLNNGKVEVCLKEDVDKVIAEKDAEIARLNDKALQYKVLDEEHCRDLNTQERRFALQIAHHKYKRCMAMAKVCYLRFVRYENYLQKLCASDATIAAYKFRRDLYDKWEKRWLELADKFKPNKEVK